MSGHKFEFGQMVRVRINLRGATADGVWLSRSNEHVDESHCMIGFRNGRVLTCPVEDVTPLTPYTPPPPPNTVPVRVAVAVAADGSWDAEGASLSPDEESESVALASLNQGLASRITWITAYAYLPEPPAEVRGGGRCSREAPEGSHQSPFRSADLPTQARGRVCHPSYPHDT